MTLRKTIAIFLALLLAWCLVLPAGASSYASTTLRNGMRGEEVRQLQEALISLGYLKGTADGIFGNNTENAVRKFQRKNKLISDGLAGTKTRDLIMKQAAGSSAPAAETTRGEEPAADPKETASAAPAAAASSSGGSLFGGNYSTIRPGAQGSRVRAMQQALISLNYLSGSADGKYGPKTQAAVKAFQRGNRLTADGLAGRKTLTALESAVAGGKTSSEAAPAPASPDPSPGSDSAPQTDTSGPVNEKISAPSAGSVQLLSWYDQVKPSISGRQDLLIYDPSSGLSWTVRVLARGRHCDAEPVTQQDTNTMVKAFGGKNTWNQKGVYVRLPDGRWTVGSTHDMPHQNGNIKDNGFNGHLCVHFYRTMEEAQKNDPNYGVSNQKTIRSLWKKTSGQDITD